jgi:hypothetical protein
MNFSPTSSHIVATFLAGVTAIVPAAVLTIVRPVMAQTVVTGQGTLTLAGRPALSITSIAIATSADYAAQLALQLGRSSRLAFGGQVIGQDKKHNQLRIQLTNSGDADATGNVVVEYDAGGAIKSLSGNGTIDGQPFSIKFSH